MATQNPGKDEYLRQEYENVDMFDTHGSPVFRISNMELSLKEAREHLKTVLGNAEDAEEYINLLLLDDITTHLTDALLV